MSTHNDPTGLYCANPECGADDDHLDSWIDANGVIWVGCHKCGFAGKVN